MTATTTKRSGRPAVADGDSATTQSGDSARARSGRAARTSPARAVRRKADRAEPSAGAARQAGAGAAVNRKTAKKEATRKETTKKQAANGKATTGKATAGKAIKGSATNGKTAAGKTAAGKTVRGGARQAPAPGRTAGRIADATRTRAELPTRVATPPRAPFVLLIVGLLGGALVSLLLLNTVLAQDAFTLTELQRSNKRLEQQRQALQEEIAREESPAILEQKARALGMRPASRPAFVDARTGDLAGGGVRPVPDAATAAAGAAGVAGVPGAVVPTGASPPPATRERSE